MNLRDVPANLKKWVKPEDTLVGKLKTLSEDLGNIADLKGLTRHPGWVKLRRALEDKIVQAEAERFKLDEDPQKNHRQIMAIREFQRALSLILFTIDGNIAFEAELLKLRPYYTELLEAAEVKARDFKLPEWSDQKQEK